MTAVAVKSDLNVFYNGVILPGLTGVNIDEKSEVKEAYEFLSDEAWAAISSFRTYYITLSFIGKNPILVNSGFSITVEKDNARAVYNNCCIKSLKESYSDGKLTAEVIILSSEKE